MGGPAQRGGCWFISHLREENARFLLHALVMVVYLLCGASVFMLLEREQEKEDKREYRRFYEAFLVAHNLSDEASRVQLQQLLDRHALFASLGLTDDKRDRWDFAGAFYFVGTVVSTIGFGMTTPRTTAGKLALIGYGLVGCAGAFLFFNLFLERSITLLAHVMRFFHDHCPRLRACVCRQPSAGSRRDSQASLDESAVWKPPVYWVMLCLLAAACLVALCASALYVRMEEWPWVDALYFCFVAFSTVGFGDLVGNQRAVSAQHVWYRVANFLLLVAGCCCVYSLFNVSSILIKQMLNWMLRRMDCACCYQKPRQKRTRRNAIVLGRDDDEDGRRRDSGELISMHEFVSANKVSLAFLQKQLWETARRGQWADADPSMAAGVGPLAILNRKLGDET